MAFNRHQLVIFAARSGNLALLRERARSGGDLNYQAPRHGSPLIAAIRAGKVRAVKWLLENGADVNAECGGQTGPLEVALEYPDPEMVGLLLGAGARLRRRARPHYATRLEERLRILGQSRRSSRRTASE